MSRDGAIRILADRSEIEQLRGAYAVASDRHDFDAVADLFAPDGEVQTAQDPPIVGRETLRAFYRTLPSIMGTWSHHNTTSTLELTSDDTARGVQYFLFAANWPDGRARFEAGHYDDDYRRVDGRWRIQRRRVVWFWTRFMDWPGDWTQVTPTFSE
ncbi:hypothetical protein GCM10009775_23870 [Microbacterium aoyamense]|uniref:SnoaL-like domain-containing protein n=1 Tax=Microbacterium aoyamense TaxID=344166 RepID=A0ABP5B4P9_9MICO|nr:nuclear transport factor 2 family protein [Microbacterium aoyamense]